MVDQARVPIDGEHLFEHSGGLFGVVDTGGRIVRISRAWEDATGHSVEDLEGSRYLDYLHPDDVELTTRIVGALAPGAPVNGIRNRYRCKDGSYRWFEWLSLSTDGMHVYCVAQDITEEIEAVQRAETLERIQDEAERIAGLGSWRLEIPGGRLTWSPQMYRLFGVDPGGPELDLGEATARAIHPDDRERIQRVNEEVLRDGTPRPAQYRILRRDGEVRWVDARGRQEFDQTGNAVALTGFVQDITEQREAEAEIRRAEKLYRTTFERANVGIARVGTDGSWLKVNQRLCDMLGYAREELLGAQFADITHPDDIGENLEHLGKLVAGEEDTYEGEKRYTRKDGSLLWASVSVALVRDEQGAPDFFVTIVDDITERHLMEEDLRVYAGLLDLSPTSISVHSPDGDFLYANERTLELHGYTREEYLALNLHEIDVPESAAHIEGRVQRLRTSGEISFESTHYRKDGSTFPMLVTARVTRWGDRDVILSAATDITERKAAEAALVEGNAQLERMVHDVAEAMGRVVETRDPYTQGHQERVAALSRAIAQQMGLSEDETYAVEMAALVHDIGKLGVPAEILSKPGGLSSIEFRLVQSHPRYGYDILKDIAFPWPVADIALQHHERIDGSGYPSGLVGAETLLAARIIAVADVVEAMSSHRPYRPALGLQAALAEVSSSREKFDADAVAACMALNTEGRIPL